MQNVAIVGTGLIGASFGLALRKAGFDGAIIGCQLRARHRAMRWRAARSIAARRSRKPSPQADLVFLSQTIGRILDTLRHLDPLLQPGALVTDAGSTKCEIVDLARAVASRARSFWAGIPWRARRRAAPRRRMPNCSAAAPGC